MEAGPDFFQIRERKLAMRDWSPWGLQIHQLTLQGNEVLVGSLDGQPWNRGNC